MDKTLKIKLTVNFLVAVAVSFAAGFLIASQIAYSMIEVSK